VTINAVSRSARWAGLAFLVAGGLGLVAGVVPFAANLPRVLGHDFGRPEYGVVAYYPWAMGMSVDWALLSSADGAFLGGLLFSAGVGWRRGRPWAPLVTLIYALGGILVCGTDLLLFTLHAKAGCVRSLMLTLDSLAFAVALLTLIGLTVWWKRR
jgi:hypothetical protein